MLHNKTLKVPKSKNQPVITKNAMSIFSLHYSDDALGRMTDRGATCGRVKETHGETAGQLRQRTGDECDGDCLSVFTVDQRHLTAWHCVVSAVDGSYWNDSELHCYLSVNHPVTIEQHNYNTDLAASGKTIPGFNEAIRWQWHRPNNREQMCVDINGTAGHFEC